MKKVPKLRFKEFVDEWKEKKIENIVEVNPRTEELPDEFIYIDLESVENGVLKEKKIIQKENAPSRAKRNVKLNDILYQTVRPYQQNNLFFNFDDEFEYIASTGYAQLRSTENNSKYIYHMLHTKKFLDKVLERCTGTSYPAINSNDLSEINIFYSPFLEEQEKIADFLSSVDVRIDLTNQKLELFEKYKKGIMQKIFKQELRFKDSNGNDYPEWEEKRLGDLITSQGGKALEKYSNDNGKYKFISIGNYSENSTFIDNGKRIDLNSETKKQLLRKNELVMILNDKTKTGNIIGRTLLIEKDDTYIYNQRSQRIICKKDFLPQFAYVLLNSSYRNNIIQNAQGGTQIYINFSTIENFSIELPCLEEQQKIADFLSSIDNKIEKIADELENLKEFKKGLLQQMFV